MADRRQSAVGDLRQQIEAARALVAEIFPFVENDDDARRDMIEGSTDLHEAIRGAVARIVEIGALEAGLKATLTQLKERLGRLERQDEAIRTAMLAAMEVGGLQRLETPLGLVTRKAVAPSVIVTNESDIPAEFWKRADPTLDKRALLAALKELPPGEHIPGAELSNGGMTIALKLADRRRRPMTTSELLENDRLALRDALEAALPEEQLEPLKKKARALADEIVDLHRMVHEGPPCGQPLVSRPRDGRTRGGGAA